MRRHLETLGKVTLLILVIAGPAQAAQPVLELPFDDTMGLVVVPVSINGSAPLRCIVDTGMPAGGFVFDPAVGKRLGLEYVGQANVGSPGDAAPTSASVALGATITLGEVTLEQQRMIVLDARHDIARLGVDAVVGESLFRAFVVRIDPERRTVSLFRREDFDPGDAGAELPLTLRGGKPFIPATVDQGPATEVPVELMVDTGMSGGLSLNPGSHPKLRTPERAIEGVVGAGIGGPRRGLHGRVDRLRLGPYALDDVIGSFPANAGERPEDRNGTVGRRVLERFRVTFDYGGQRMFLKPTADATRPFEYNMAGLVLRPLEAGSLRVDDVIADSPAAGAGVAVGDRIVAVNGKPVALRDGTRVQRLFLRPGKRLRLTIERGEERLDAAVTLRRLI